jgi:ATP phosphoribosyltransferase
MAETNAMIRLALPKGRMREGVFELLTDAGVRVRASSRGYRPTVSLPDFEAKILKPQNIIEMLGHGSRDLGFAGADWVAELEVELIELVDTGLDPVRLVAAAPRELLKQGDELPSRHLVVASEYQRLTDRWIANRGLDATAVRSYGATEVFPPEDADLIVDITQTGSTLQANDLAIIDELMRSSTRLYASPQAMSDPNKRERMESFALIIRSVLEARRRVLVEVNVDAEHLDAVIAALPAMRKPTLSPLHGGEGYAIKAAVPVELLPQVIPEIKRRGGSDVIVTKLVQIVP